MPRTTLERVLLVLIALVVITLLLPFGQESVFTGEFDLTVVISDIDLIDPDSLYFARCWREEEAEAAMRDGSAGEIPFRPADTIEQSLHNPGPPFRTSGRIQPRLFVSSSADSRHRILDDAHE